MFNTTVGKEFDFSTKEKQRVLGLNFQLVYTGGFWETPIDVAASRIAQHTVRTSGNLFSEQLPDVLKTYFRVYFDPFLDEVVHKHQLGLIPMLSYVIRI